MIALQRVLAINLFFVQYRAHPEEYTRHAHSLGVFAILRLKNASLEEQISGLLHDISHTAFSHVGDWVFAREHRDDDYQSTIHNAYLAECGIEQILNRHGYTIEQVSPKREEFQMLEQPLPNLCADRIDYNIQGAYFQQFLSYEETQRLLIDLAFESGRWVIRDLDLAVKLTRFSLFMTEDCWGSALNWMSSRWLADAILQGMEIGQISAHQFRFGTDQEIWDQLSISKDLYIQNRMVMLRSPDLYYLVVDPTEAQTFLRFKCRGIDPWVIHDREIVRLTSICEELEKSFCKTKKQSLEGWPVKVLDFENLLEKRDFTKNF